ncbi:MAG: TIR domain-containing protein [Chloroflexi bacterium]|nr:TIR domain-containing protein [Chloroflexota bacterium]
MPEPKRPLKVFLCHASTDKPKVRELYRYLRKRGIQPWFDEEHLVGGQDWQVEIPKALATSDAIIICLTKNSVDKEGYIQKEIKFALDKALEMPEGRIFLIPVKFEECEVPFSLSRYQWVDLTIESGYSKMMKALKFRASQLERATVELPKVAAVEEPKKVAIVDEQASIEKAVRDEAKRESAEIAEREKVAKEDREVVETAESKSVLVKKPPRIPVTNPGSDRIQKGNQEYQLRRRPNSQIIYALIGLTAIIIVLSLSLSTIEKWFSPAPVSTESATATITMTSQPVVPLKTIEPSQTPTQSVILAPTSLPTEITDAKGVSMMLVTVSGGNNFFMDKYEVTNALYKTCVDNGVCLLPKVANRYASESYVDHPVTYVDQSMANNYCEWRNARLPTELEWKNASLSTKTGCEYANLGLYVSTWGWYNSCTRTTDPVGSYELGKSAFGIYDLIGNVREWIADTLDGKEGGVIGGSYKTEGLDVAYTNSLNATYPDIGFRCAKDINP